MAAVPGGWLLHSCQALIIMSKPRDHPDPGIPAVFVSEKAGIIMRKLITPGQTRVRIVPVSTPLSRLSSATVT
jgi:E3 ubiquitin-protein ligase RNF13